MSGIQKYLRNVLIGFDQWVNTVFAGFPDETISARAYRQGMLNKKTRWFVMCKIINAIFFWQKNHCRGAYFSEKEGKQNSAHYIKEYK